MTTRINVTVGDGGLLDRNAQQQAANRQGYVVRNEQNKAATQGEAQLQQRRTAEGRDLATGLILPSRGSRIRRVDQEPAAFRKDYGNTYVYWFPSLPTWTTEYLTYTYFNIGLGYIDDNYTTYNGDAFNYIYYKKRPLLSNLFHLAATGLTHSAVLDYIPSGGRFGEPVLYLQSPAREGINYYPRDVVVSVGRFEAPKGGPFETDDGLGAASDISPYYTNLGITKPFTSFTTELEGSIQVYNPLIKVYFSDTIQIMNPEGTKLLYVSSKVSSGGSDSDPSSSSLVVLTLDPQLYQVGTQIDIDADYIISRHCYNLTNGLPPGTLVKSQPDAWTRCTLVYTPTESRLFVNGKLLETFAYETPVDFELDPESAIKDSKIFKGRDSTRDSPCDIKMTFASFTPEVLYSDDYTLRRIV